LLYGLGTFAWPHSKTFFSEPLTALLLFAAFVAAHRAAAGWPAVGTGGMLASGLLASLACFARLQAGIALPALGIYVLLATRLSPRSALARPASAVPALAWGLGAALGLALRGGYNWALFGSPLDTGYGALPGLAGAFTYPLPDGLYGLLLSPGRGMFWYAPPLALAVAGFAPLWRRDWRAALLCALMAAVHLAFYARLDTWHGAGAWGPRFLNTVLPFLALPLAAFLATLRGQRAPWRRSALVAAIILAAPVQLGGLAINLNSYINKERDEERRTFDPAATPIVGHLDLVVRQLRLAYEVRFAPASVALQDGFAYSEGDRERGEQLPRWTLPRARIALRPPQGADLRIDLSLEGCRPPPAPPAKVVFELDGTRVAGGVPCPARVYRLLPPPQRTTLTIASDGWEPAAAGIERPGPLGVLLRDLRATSGERRLPVYGALQPITSMPAGNNALRRWAGDHRFGHWDFWWWYLARSGLPLAPSALLAGLWLSVAGTLIALGAWQLSIGNRK
jgi:hypothetical protein